MYYKTFTSVIQRLHVAAQLITACTQRKIYWSSHNKRICDLFSKSLFSSSCTEVSLACKIPLIIRTNSSSSKASFHATLPRLPHCPFSLPFRHMGHFLSLFYICNTTLDSLFSFPSSHSLSKVMLTSEKGQVLLFDLQHRVHREAVEWRKNAHQLPRHRRYGVGYTDAHHLFVSSFH